MGVNTLNNDGVISGDAGRIGFLIKGEYNSTETYDFLDVVYYENSSYVAKKETVGNIPQENNEYWQILAKGGISGTAGVIGVKGEAESTYRTGNVNIAKENIGLSEVENKSSKSIISEITTSDIKKVLGFTPAKSAIYTEDGVRFRNKMDNTLRFFAGVFYPESDNTYGYLMVKSTDGEKQIVLDGNGCNINMDGTLTASEIKMTGAYSGVVTINGVVFTISNGIVTNVVKS